jgi:iron complex outermembrane recepter protein
MKFRSKSVLLASVAAAVLPMTPVFAQETSSDAASTDSSSAPNDIVVTARKVKETLQDAPLAVSVVTGEFLDRTGFSQVSEVVRFVPGIALSPLNTTRASGSKIRGISTFSFSDGFESSVSTVVDGVVLGREAQGFADFLDVQSIEVIKGPQGTLFGKNASAGVINIKTNDPEFEFGGSADATYGSFDEMKVRGTVTGPIVGDRLAFRLTGTYNKRDGVLDNAIPGQRDLNDRDGYSLRGKLLFQPSDDLRIVLTGDIGHSKNHCCIATFRTAGPSIGLLNFATNPGVLQLRTALAANGIVPGPHNRKVGVLYNRLLETQSPRGLALNVDYDFGNSSLTSITSWRKWGINEFNEADGVSNSNVNSRNGTKVNTEQFTQEVRLNTNIGSAADIVAGLFFFHQNLAVPDAHVDIELALPFPGFFFNARTDATRAVSTDSYAAFGEATFHLTDKASIIVGGRYTHDSLLATYKRTTVAFDPTKPFSGFFGPDYTGIQSFKNDNLSGRVIGRYLWTDDIMTYVSWSRGYKGPGIDVAESVNVAAVLSPGGLPVLKPEIPTLWEAGIRTSLFDKALTTNITLYSQQLRNLQTITPSAVGAALNIGIDLLKSKGIEAEVILRPAALPGLTLTGAYTLNDIKIAKFAANPALVGLRFRDNAHDFYSIIGDYRTALGSSNFQGFVRAEYAWQSAKNTDLAGRPLYNVASYGLLNLRVGFEGPDNKYGVTFSVENVTNKDYVHYIFPSSYGVLDGGQTTNQYIGDPRTWKVTLRGKF